MAIALAGSVFAANTVIKPVALIGIVEHLARVRHERGVSPVVDVKRIGPLAEIIPIRSERDICSTARALIVLVHPRKESGLHVADFSRWRVPRRSPVLGARGA